LHAHEEGIEAQAQAMLVDYGSPKQIERMMETVRALDEKIILKTRQAIVIFVQVLAVQRSLMKVFGMDVATPEFLLLQPALTLLNLMEIRAHVSWQLMWRMDC